MLAAWVQLNEVCARATGEERGRYQRRPRAALGFDPDPDAVPVLHGTRSRAVEIGAILVEASKTDCAGSGVAIGHPRKKRHEARHELPVRGLGGTRQDREAAT